MDEINLVRFSRLCNAASGGDHATRSGLAVALPLGSSPKRWCMTKRLDARAFA